MTDITKAWNTFKKEIVKEIVAEGGNEWIKGCMYMNKRQQETRTATICIGVHRESNITRNNARVEFIKESAAFKKLAEAIGIKTARTEIKSGGKGYYDVEYFRITY